MAPIAAACAVVDRKLAVSDEDVKLFSARLRPALRSMRVTPAPAVPRLQRFLHEHPTVSIGSVLEEWLGTLPVGQVDWALLQRFHDESKIAAIIEASAHLNNQLAMILARRAAAITNDTKALADYITDRCPINVKIANYLVSLQAHGAREHAALARAQPGAYSIVVKHLVARETADYSPETIKQVLSVTKDASLSLIDNVLSQLVLDGTPIARLKALLTADPNRAESLRRAVDGATAETLKRLS